MEASGSRDGCCQVYLTEMVLTRVIFTGNSVGAGSDSRSGFFPGRKPVLVTKVVAVILMILCQVRNGFSVYMLPNF
jgi:hypothetical protein